jgi:hypothetical protein
MLAPMPTARGDLAAAAAAGLVYVIGGFDTAGGPVATVEIYRAASNTWTAGRRCRRRWAAMPPLP